MKYYFYRLLEAAGINVRNFIVDYYNEAGQPCHKNVQLLYNMCHNDDDVIKHIKQTFSEKHYKVYSIIEVVGQLLLQEVEDIAIGKGKKSDIYFRMVYMDKKQWAKANKR